MFLHQLTINHSFLVHQVSSQLGLHHVSVGEGEERHIQVSKLQLPDAGVEKKEVENTTSSDTVSQSVASGGSEEKCSVAVTSVHDRSHESLGGTKTDCCSSLSEVEETLKSEVSVNKANLEKSSVDKMTEEVQRLKLDSDVASNIASSESSSVSASDASREDPIKIVTAMACSLCQKEIPKANFSLHELNCQRQMRAASAAAAVEPKRNGILDPSERPTSALSSKASKKKEARQKEKKEKAKPKVTHVQKAEEVLKKIDDDDFDGLIASITQLDGKCSFKKCKTLTTTLGRNCEFCTRRFCLSHLQPEVHGCGSAAKDAARRLISRDGVLHAGSGRPNKKPDQVKRAHLEKKLEKKLGDLAGSRNRKSDKKS